jgi:hypothetical protein
VVTDTCSLILDDRAEERQAALLCALREELKPHGVTGLLIRYNRLVLSGADDSGYSYSGRTPPELRVSSGRPGITVIVISGNAYVLGRDSYPVDDLTHDGLARIAKEISESLV